MCLCSLIVGSVFFAKLASSGSDALVALSNKRDRLVVTHDHVLAIGFVEGGASPRS